LYQLQGAITAANVATAFTGVRYREDGESCVGTTTTTTTTTTTRSGSGQTSNLADSVGLRSLPVQPSPPPPSVAAFVAIRVLDLRSPIVNNEVVCAAALACPALRTVCIAGEGGRVGASGISALVSHCRELEALELIACVFDAAALDAICREARCLTALRLRSLAPCEDPATDAQMARLVQVLPRITELDVGAHGAQFGGDFLSLAHDAALASNFVAPPALSPAIVTPSVASPSPSSTASYAPALLRRLRTLGLKFVAARIQDDALVALAALLMVPPAAPFMPGPGESGSWSSMCSASSSSLGQMRSNLVSLDLSQSRRAGSFTSNGLVTFFSGADSLDPTLSMSGRSSVLSPPPPSCRFPTLTALDLGCSYGKVSNAVLTAVASACPRLRRLCVDTTGAVGDAGVAAIAGSRCAPRLEVFLFGATAVTDAALAAVGAGCPRLRAIGCGGTEVGDVGVTSLAAGCPLLLDVDLRATRVSRIGVVALGRACPHLRELTIAQSGHHVPDDALREVARLCPDIVIHGCGESMWSRSALHILAGHKSS
jgi:hypothetical protein